MDTPSRVPAVPEFTKLPPQLLLSMVYGRFVYAMSPRVLLDALVQLCQAHQLFFVVLKSSGWVPVGETTTYWALRLSCGVLLPKWLAAVTASLLICVAVAVPGVADPLSYHVPASAPPYG